MNLRTLMRVGDVTRWHIVRTARQQTLAEHLYKTWLLTGALFDAIGLPASTRAATLHWALTHDQPEVLIGDMPTPVKRTVEVRADDPDIWRKLERDMLPDHKQPLVEGTPTAYVVKIADCLEGWHFLVTEAVGDHAADTRVQLLQRALSTAKAAQALWDEYHWVDGVRGVINLLASGKIEHCE